VAIRLRLLVARLPLRCDVGVERDAARLFGLERRLELVDLTLLLLCLGRAPRR